jgi:drug/metabolite transporter (DMT)-like permease
MSAAPQMKPRDWGMIAILAAVWGGSFMFIELGLTGFGPLTLVFLRMAVAVPLMVLVLYGLGLRLPNDGKSWLHLTALGFLNIAFPMALFFWAQTRIDSGLASILNATVPLWGVLLTHIFTEDERATPAKIIGLLVGFGGLVLVVGPSALGGVGQDVVAQLACLLATFCFAAAVIYARKLGQTIAPMAAATGQILAAAIMLAPLPLMFEAPFAGPPPPLMAIAAVLMLSLVATSLAYLIFFRLIDSAGAGNAMLIALVMPPVALVLGVVVLGERLTSGDIAGMALILVGLVIIDGRLVARLAPGRAVP